MRTLSDTLKVAQQASSLDPVIKITLSHTGDDDVVIECEKIKSIRHEEEPYRQSAEISLDNSEGYFTDKDVKGWKAVISYGLLTSAGEELSATAPLWVIYPQLDSSPGKLTCELRMVGIPNLLSQDKANAEYIPLQEDAGWEWTIKTLLTKLLGATLACYNHCTPYTIVWGDLDSVIDSYKPRDSFRIAINSSRLAHIRRLLDLTKCVMIFKADGKAHIFQPVTSGETFDYEYSLETGHTFFAKAHRKALVIPNRIVVQSNPDDDPKYSGEATDAESYALLPKTEYKQMSLESNDQANNIAAAALSKEQLWAEMGAAEVPLNCGQEVFDYVKVTDERESDYRIGNIGTLTRTYKPGQYPMRFSFGGWLSVRKLLDDLETNSAPEWDFLSLSVKDLLIERVVAYWLDPEGNIKAEELTSDFLDKLPDGKKYATVKKMHLDATGLALVSHTIYTLRLPGEAAKRVWKSTTAQSSPDTGDLWIDTNFTPNRVKRWSGTEWQELPAEDIADLEKGIFIREVKSSSLTAEGLVFLDQLDTSGDYERVKKSALTAEGLILLDEVVEGDYGLVKSTDISAGHIILSSVEQTTNYRTVSDGEKGTWSGKPNDMDDIGEGVIYQRVKSAALSVDGLVILDQVVEGTYGLIKQTDISAGHIILSTVKGDIDDVDEGSIYGKVRKTDISAGHIKLYVDQNLDEQGIEIVSSSSSTRIRINEHRIAGYKAGVKQFYLEADDGKAYFAGGSSILDDEGLHVRGNIKAILFESSGGSEEAEIWRAGPGVLYIGADTRVSIRNWLTPITSLGSYALLGEPNHIWRHCYLRNIRPGAHEQGAIGYSTEAYAQIVGEYIYSSDGAIHSYQGHDDIALLKAIKTKKKKGKDVIDAKTLPKELVAENDYVNIAGLAGLSIGIQKALLARVEALEARG